MGRGWKMDVYRQKPLPVIYTHLPFVRRSPNAFADLPEDRNWLDRLKMVAQWKTLRIDFGEPAPTHHKVPVSRRHFAERWKHGQRHYMAVLLLANVGYRVADPSQGAGTSNTARTSRN